MTLRNYVTKNITGEFFLQSDDAMVLVKDSERCDILIWFGSFNVKKVEQEQEELTTIYI